MFSKPIYAWHFSDGYLRFDYEGTKIEAGLVLETKDALIPEKSGFHACVNPIHALRWFAVRPTSDIVVSRVRLSGSTLEDNSASTKLKGTRLVAQKREHLWVVDASESIEQFIDYYLAQYEKASVFFDVSLNKIQTDIDKAIAYWNRQTSKTIPNTNLRRVRPSGFFALEVVDSINNVVEAIRSRMVWQAAKADNYTIEEHIQYTEYESRYCIRPSGRQENKRLERGLYQKMFRSPAFLAPPIHRYPYPEIDIVPPDEKLHEMLMQLAPEGYSEEADGG